MTLSPLLHTTCLDHERNKRATLSGHCCSVILKQNQFSRYPLLFFKLWIEQAISHDQIMLLFDSYYNPVGFVIWAHLAPDTEHRYLHERQCVFHPSEWNEGGRTWIVDACIGLGTFTGAYKLLRERLSSEGVKEVRWAKRNNDGSLKKIMSRSL